MKKQIKSFFLKPSNRIGLGVLVTLGFIAGAIAWQQFNMSWMRQAQKSFV